MNCDNFSVLPFDDKSDCANLASNWNRWLRSFSYMVQGRAIAAVDQKRALLLHLAGPDVQDLYETLVALEVRKVRMRMTLLLVVLTIILHLSLAKHLSVIYSGKLFNKLVKHVINF